MSPGVHAREFMGTQLGMEFMGYEVCASLDLQGTRRLCGRAGGPSVSGPPSS